MSRFAAWAWVAIALAAGPARAAGVGVGVFGGVGLPVIQQDTGQGPQFGLRLPVRLLPFATVEPYYAHTSGGEKDQSLGDLTVVYDGIDVSSYGANLLLTFGRRIQIFPYAGIGTFQMTRPQFDEVKTGYIFGLGLGLSPLPRLSLQLRGELAAVVEGDVSRKWANVTGGISYDVFEFPGR
jgi:hypothetical protein